MWRSQTLCKIVQFHRCLYTVIQPGTTWEPASTDIYLCYIFSASQDESGELKSTRSCLNVIQCQKQGKTSEHFEMACFSEPRFMPQTNMKKVVLIFLLVSLGILIWLELLGPPFSFMSFHNYHHFLLCQKVGPQRHSVYMRCQQKYREIAI